MKLLGEPNKKQVFFVVHPKKVSLSISMKCCPHSDPTRSTTAAPPRSTKNVPQYSFLVQIHEITGCICIETQMNKKLAYSKLILYQKSSLSAPMAHDRYEWTFCAMPQEEGLNNGVSGFCACCGVYQTANAADELLPQRKTPIYHASRSLLYGYFSL